MGSWIASTGSSLLTKAAVAVVDMVGGGLTAVASYLIHEPNPTLAGTAAAFGIGAGTVGLFMGAGAVISKGWGWAWAKGAVGFGGAGKASLESALVEASSTSNLTPRGAVRGGHTETVTGRTASSNAQEALRSRVLQNIDESRKARAASRFHEHALSEALPKTAEPGPSPHPGPVSGELSRSLPETAQPLPRTASKTNRHQGASSPSLPLQAGDAGSYRELQRRGVRGDGLTPHHMPQAASKRTGYNEGAALALPYEEHLLTRTYGAKGRVTLMEDAEMPFRNVLAIDIRDVRRIAGSKYNKGLLKLTKYYNEHSPELMKKGETIHVRSSR